MTMTELRDHVLELVGNETRWDDDEERERNVEAAVRLLELALRRRRPPAGDRRGAPESREPGNGGRPVRSGKRSRKPRSRSRSERSAGKAPTRAGTTDGAEPRSAAPTDAELVRGLEEAAGGDNSAAYAWSVHRVRHRCAELRRILEATRRKGAGTRDAGSAERRLHALCTALDRAIPEQQNVVDRERTLAAERDEAFASCLQKARNEDVDPVLDRATVEERLRKYDIDPCRGSIAALWGQALDEDVVNDLEWEATRRATGPIWLASPVSAHRA